MSESSTVVGETTVAKEGKPESAVVVVVGEIGVTNAEPGNKEASVSFTGEIGVAKAELGNKEKEAAGKGVVTEVDWNDFVFPVNPPVGSELKAEPTGAMITKERVPDSFIDRLKSRHVNTKLPPLCNASGVFDKFPNTRDICLDTIARWNYLVDLHVDVLRQLKEKSFAEVGVDFTDGVKKIFILPQK